MKKELKLTYNSPVVLSFLIISFVMLIANYFTGGMCNKLFSSNATLLNPLSYIRLITYVFCHSGWEHFFGNMLLFVLIGPLLEEKYGSKELAVMMLLTSLLTGIINGIFFPNVAIVGASGIIFMFIVLSSFTSFQNREIPLTFIVILLMYVGNEIIDGVISDDNISQFAHILGGVFGIIFGFLERYSKK